MKNLFTPSRGGDAVPELFRPRRVALIAAALAVLALLPFGALTLAQAQETPGFDRPALLDAAPEAVRADLEAADRHILVVRHARKADEACNALECPLGETGEAMVTALAALIGEEPVDAAYASAACRAARTAEAGGAWVVMHRAGDNYPLACGGGTVDRTRAEAINDARESLHRWTLVGEHSNTVCLWVASFAGPDAAAEAGCDENGALGSEAYGHVYWLYRLGGQWHGVTLDGAFEVAE